MKLNEFSHCGKRWLKPVCFSANFMSDNSNDYSSETESDDIDYLSQLGWHQCVRRHGRKGLYVL